MRHVVRWLLASIVGAAGIYLLDVRIDSLLELTGILLVIAGANIMSGGDS